MNIDQTNEDLIIDDEDFSSLDKVLASLQMTKGKSIYGSGLSKNYKEMCEESNILSPCDDISILYKDITSYSLR